MGWITENPRRDYAHPKHGEKFDWVSRGKGLRLFTYIREAVSRMTDRDRELILSLTGKLNGRRKSARNLEPLTKV
jgi:hypothetical protein